MKESIKVNLAGQLFDLDIDAYQHLKSYLDSLSLKFGSSPEEAEEIVADIEARIAELLMQRRTDIKQVINLDDVKEVTSQLGSAEEMDEGEQSMGNEDSSQEPGTSYSKGKKRFYRDTDNSVIAGVASGLAAYFNMDVIWVRLSFVGLVLINFILYTGPLVFNFGGVGLILYIVFWAIIPPANTTAQKLQMKGKAVNITNIQESVKEEFGKVKSNFKTMSDSKGYKNMQSGLSGFLNSFGEVLIAIIKFIGRFVGIVIIIALVITIVSVLAGGATLINFSWFNNWHLPDVEHLANFSIAGICLFLIIAIPIFALIIKLSKWIFGIKSRNRVAAGFAATIWVIALIAFIVMLASGINNNTFKNKHSKIERFSAPKENKLFVDVNTEYSGSSWIKRYQFFDHEFVYDDLRDHFLQHPKVSIYKTNSNDIKVEVIRSYNDVKVGRIDFPLSKRIKYNYRLEGNTLILDEYYVVDEAYIWRLPQVHIKIGIANSITTECSQRAHDLLNVNCSQQESRNKSFDTKRSKSIDSIATEEKEDILKELEKNI